MIRLNPFMVSLVALVTVVLIALAPREKNLLPVFLSGSSTVLTPNSVTYSLNLQTSASEGEVLNFASGTPSDLRRGFYLQITPPNVSCYETNSAGTVHGALLLVVAGVSNDVTFCSRNQVNDGKLHAVALKFLSNSALLSVDGKEELIPIPEVNLNELARIGTMNGTLLWAPVLSQGTSDRKLLIESRYPEPVN